MKLFLAIGMGFAASLLAAVLIGFFIGTMFPLAHGSPAFYAAEFAGIVISLTLWYFLARRIHRHLTRKEAQLAERLA